ATRNHEGREHRNEGDELGFHWFCGVVELSLTNTTLSCVSLLMFTVICLVRLLTTRSPASRNSTDAVCSPAGSGNEANVMNWGRLSHVRTSASGLVLAETIFVASPASK